ncbi:MAG: MATE family efflux transporter [Vicingaceae bacterium]
MHVELFGRRFPVYLIVTSSSLVSKGITSVLGIISIRILTDQLPDDAYAIIVLLTNIFVWFTLFDFGIGHSLQNYISEANAKNESSSAYIFWGGCAGIVIFIIGFIGFYFFSDYLGNQYLKEFSNFSPGSRGFLFFYSSILWLLNITGDIAYKIWYGQNKGYIPNLLVGLARVLSFVAILLLAANPQMGTTLNYLIASILPLGAFPMIFLFYHIYVNRDGAKENGFQVLSSLMRRGYKFWIFTAFLFIPFQTDYLFISQYLSDTEVVKYNFLKKIFDMVFFIYTALLAALWPEFAQLLVSNKWKEVLSKSRKYLSMGIIYLVFSTLVVFYFDEEIKSLLMPDTNFQPSSLLVFLIGGYFLIRVWSDSFQVILQSNNQLQTLIVVSFFNLVLNVLLQWLLVEPLGLIGIVLGLIIPALLTSVWAYPRKVFSLAKPHQLKSS